MDHVGPLKPFLLVLFFECGRELINYINYKICRFTIETADAADSADLPPKQLIVLLTNGRMGFTILPTK